MILPRVVLRRFSTRFLSTALPENILVSHRLVTRSAVEVSGPDAKPFLQGLITNDINRMDEENRSCMYTVFLNVQGRIMFDSIVFRGKQGFVLECDAGLDSVLIQHLKLYKVRRKVEITRRSDLKIWTLFKPNADSSTSINVEEFNFNDDSIVGEDPRVPALGFRVVTSDSDFDSKVLHHHQIQNSQYKDFRYRLGVTEGLDETPVGKCFPLEYNVDYLNGVSFLKGCYIGQELTARTHHTGVVRKRILPLQLNSGEIPVEKGHSVINENSNVVGQIRGVGDEFAIALMRVEEASKARELKIKETGSDVKLLFPSWWPKKDV